MFEVPESKRLKRADFGRDSNASSRASSPTSDAGAEEYRVLNHLFEYEYVDIAQPTDPASEDAAQISNDEEGDQTYSFRLFAQPAKNKSSEAESEQKITLRAQQPTSAVPLSEGRFVRPKRPESFYFTSSLPTAELVQIREQYQSIAISSEEVFASSKQRWPGTTLPWRVIHVPSSTKPSKHDNTRASIPLTSNEPSKRSKPNKMRRIQLRRLQAARTASANAIARATEPEEEKEKALREKKSAKNRKNQLRRREKERLKKAEVKADEEGNAVD